MNLFRRARTSTGHGTCRSSLPAIGALAAWLVLTSCGTSPADIVYGPCGEGQCEDNNPCTIDTCSPMGNCKHEVRTGECQDGNACTTGDHCAAGECVGTAFDCNDGFVCTVDSCDKAEGCVHLPNLASACDDANVCTTDACDPNTGCAHAQNQAPCSDGNPCTLYDTCGGGACLPGSVTTPCDDQNPCTNDGCDAATGKCTHGPNTHACDDGNPCTENDTCAALACAGTLSCACALKSDMVLPALDNCDTPLDDNCDGKINEPATCGPTLYKFNLKPDCGAVCYNDEAHNIAVSGAGKADDSSGFGTFASGQLLDGARGVDDWGADLGNGVGYEWVAWSAPLPVVTVQFAKPRNLSLVRIGLNNRKDGAVSQPPEIQLRVSVDGIKWTQLEPFTLAAGTLPSIPAGKRGDVELTFPLQLARFVGISFVTPGSWSFVDELEFD